MEMGIFFHEYDIPKYKHITVLVPLSLMSVKM